MPMLQCIAFLCVIYVAESAHKHRHEQLSRMKQYSLLSVSAEIVDEHSRLLEFVAFDQHYVVELIRKREWAPSTVRHTNVDEEVHGPLSSVEESCHFTGRVLSDADDSVVSASLCTGRGLRARISAFGETIIMKPSAYYLDLEADKLANHSLDGEVLVYRLSDFDKPLTMVTDEAAVAEPSFDGEADDVLMASDEALRRRLYSAGSPAHTEVAVVIGPVRTANYKADYGTNWYSQLYHDTADIMNSVDTIYSNTNWNLGTRNSVGGRGSLRIVMSEIHVIYSFSGIYSGMAPTKRLAASCPLAADKYDDSNECSIDGRGFLGLFQNWISNNMDTADYDSVQLMTDIMFKWTACSQGNGVCGRTLGWGTIGEVCRGSRSSAVNSVVDDMGGNDDAVGTVAHELGHNFGLHHDGVPIPGPGPAPFCCADCGLMGYGSNHNTFSGCSLDLMEEYFNGDGDSLQCLGVGWNGNTVSNVNVGESANPSPTAAPDGDDTDSCDSSYSRICVIESGTYGAYDGYYDALGCFNGTRYYNGSYGDYLCFDPLYSKWTITSELCDRGSVISSTTTAEAGVLSSTNWFYSSSGTSYHNLDPDMEVYDCSYLRNSALNFDDLRCLDEKAYDDEICFSTNNSLWSGAAHRTFELFDELCSNEEPIYHFVEYNDSKSLRLPSGKVLDAEVAATWYLHFELVYPTVTDNETVGQWWLSKDEMTEYNRIAFCEQDDLMQCTSNRWNVEVTSRGVDDGTVYNMLDAVSSVLDGHCDLHFAALDGSADSNDFNLSVEIITAIAAVALLCVVMIFVVGLCAWRRQKYQQYQSDALKLQQSALDQQQVHAVIDDGDETTVISVDVDVDSIRL